MEELLVCEIVKVVDSLDFPVGVRVLEAELDFDEVILVLGVGLSLLIRLSVVLPVDETLTVGVGVGVSVGVVDRLLDHWQILLLRSTLIPSLKENHLLWMSGWHWMTLSHLC